MDDRLQREITSRTARTYEAGVQNAYRMIENAEIVYKHANATDVTRAKIDAQLVEQYHRFQNSGRFDDFDLGVVDTLKRYLYDRGLISFEE